MDSQNQSICFSQTTTAFKCKCTWHFLSQEVRPLLPIQLTSHNYYNYCSRQGWGCNISRHVHVLYERIKKKISLCYSFFFFYYSFLANLKECKNILRKSAYGVSVTCKCLSSFGSLTVGGFTSPFIRWPNVSWLFLSAMSSASGLILTAGGFSSHLNRAIKSTSCSNDWKHFQERSVRWESLDSLSTWVFTDLSQAEC